MAYFNERFEVSKEELNKYGAFNCNLQCDTPYNFDPFLLYSNKDNEEYSHLYENLIQYFVFLKKKKVSKIDFNDFAEFINLNEIKNTWLGFCQDGNEGHGLDIDFAKYLYENIDKLSTSQSITETSHFERIFLFKEGISIDKISDLETNLILEFLCNYTQKFALNYINSKFLRDFEIDYYKGNADIYQEVTETFTLPYIKNRRSDEEYVLLVPKALIRTGYLEITTKDLKGNINNIITSIVRNAQSTRDTLSMIFAESIFQYDKNKKLSYHQRNTLKKEFAIMQMEENPRLLDFYIKLKEDDKEIIKQNCTKNLDREIINNFENVIIFEKLYESLSSSNKVHNFFLTCSQFFSFSFKTANKIEFDISAEYKITTFLNFCCQQIFNCPLTQLQKNKLYLKLDTNIIDTRETDNERFILNAKLDYTYLIFFTSIRTKKSVIENIKNKNLYDKIDKTLFFVDTCK